MSKQLQQYVANNHLNIIIRTLCPKCVKRLGSQSLAEEDILELLCTLFLDNHGFVEVIILRENHILNDNAKPIDLEDVIGNLNYNTIYSDVPVHPKPQSRCTQLGLDSIMATAEKLVTLFEGEKSPFLDIVGYNEVKQALTRTKHSCFTNSIRNAIKFSREHVVYSKLPNLMLGFLFEHNLINLMLSRTSRFDFSSEDLLEGFSDFFRKIIPYLYPCTQCSEYIAAVSCARTILFISERNELKSQLNKEIMFESIKFTVRVELGQNNDILSIISSFVGLDLVKERLQIVSGKSARDVLFKNSEVINKITSAQYDVEILSELSRHSFYPSSQLNSDV